MGCSAEGGVVQKKAEPGGGDGLFCARARPGEGQIRSASRRPGLGVL